MGLYPIEYQAPQFKKSYRNCRNNKGGTINKEDPVAYVSGTKAQVKACFITDCTHTFYIRGLGPTITTGPINFPSQIVTPSGGQVIYEWHAASINFIDAQVRYFENFEITWQMSDDETTWIDIDKSKNKLYVTHNQPEIAIPGEDTNGRMYRSGIGYEWFESLLDISCKNADKKLNQVDIFNEIWSHFTKNAVVNSKNESLNYYYHWDLPVSSTNSSYLLKYRDGQCYSWCSLLIDLLKIQGIDQADDLILVDAPDNEFFLIKDWNTLNNPFQTFNTFTSCEINNSYTFITKTDLDIVQKIGNNYFYDFHYNEVEDIEGVVGQGAPNPESWFQQHCLVYLGFMGKYFDPSYGKTYSSINEFRDESIGLWICYGNRTLETLYDDLDPNNVYLPNYDFNGDGDLDDQVDEYRAYTNISQFNLTTKTFNR